jgi:hypothetical protein
VGTPGVLMSGDGVVATASASVPTGTRTIMTVSSGSIGAGASVTVVLTGLTIGSQPMTGTSIGVVNCSTSADTLTSSSVLAGPINYNLARASTISTTTLPAATSPPTTTAPLNHPLVVMKLSGSISSFSEDSERRSSFISGLAVILGIEKWQVVIKSVKPGSVIVELEFLRNTNSSVGPLQVVSRLQEASLSGRLEQFGLEDLTIGGQKAHSGVQPSVGISCLIGSDVECSPALAIISNTQHRWDACWSCKNSKFRSVSVGGCFNNATLRLMSPKCSDAEASCLSEGRIGSSFSTCSSTNCNTCSAAAPLFFISRMIMTVTVILSLICAT